MTRFLTPAKIGLLALIELYTESAVPTAATTAVLSFIISHLLPASLPRPNNRSHGDGTRTSVQSFSLEVKDFEKLLNSYPAAAGMPGRSLYDLFLSKLWSINSLDALHVFFERRSYLLMKPKEELERDRELGIPLPSPDMIVISRTSPFGTFIRRAQLEFTRLKFQDVLNLWRAFISYRQPTMLRWRKINPAANEWSFDAALQDGDPAWTDDVLGDFANIAYEHLMRGGPDVNGAVSTNDMEKLFEFQIEQMQKLGTRIPQSVKDQCKGFLDGTKVVPSISHYVSFLDAWQAGDFTTSFDMLHRFFDYTMQNRDRLFYQYALLNLAVLQADFGCFHEAVAAMHETVTTARENKDMACLNFALNWLYHFGKAHPRVINETGQNDMLGVERESLAFLRTKARETGMWNLWSSALLSEAKLGLANGESVATAFENITKSSALAVSKNMLSGVGMQMMVQSAIWSRLGISRLAWSYCETFLQCHTRFSSYEDILRFNCRMAFMLMQRGQYSAAMEKLEQLDSNALRSLKTQQHWMRFRGLLQLKRDVHRDDLAGAELLLPQLLDSSMHDPDIRLEVDFLSIEVMMRRADYDKALATVDQIFKDLKDDGQDAYYQVKMLVLKALVHDRCGRPQKGFSLAVKAASIAWRSMMLPLLWQAMGAIANILNSLDEFAAAARILAAVLPRAEECDDCLLAAQLYSVMVDAHMGIAGQAAPDSRPRTQALMRARDFIDRAFNHYSSLEDVRGQCEMMAKKATVMKLVGDHALADDYAAAYLDLKRGATMIAA